jgi:hypothetical protein
MDPTLWMVKHIIWLPLALTLVHIHKCLSILVIVYLQNEPTHLFNK